MTRDQSRFLLGRISAAYGRALPGPDVVDEWANALEPWPADVANDALTRLVRAGGPGPNVAQLIREIRSHERPEATRFNREWDGPTDKGRATIATVRAKLAVVPPTEELYRKRRPEWDEEQ